MSNLGKNHKSLQPSGSVPSLLGMEGLIIPSFRQGPCLINKIIRVSFWERKGIKKKPDQMEEALHSRATRSCWVTWNIGRPHIREAKETSGRPILVVQHHYTDCILYVTHGRWYLYYSWQISGQEEIFGFLSTYMPCPSKMAWLFSFAWVFNSPFTTASASGKLIIPVSFKERMHCFRKTRQRKCWPPSLSQSGNVSGIFPPHPRVDCPQDSLVVSCQIEYMTAE